MIVTCEKCNNSFELADELIEESGSEVKCSECEHTFTVRQSAAPGGSEHSQEPEMDASDLLESGDEPAAEEFDIEALGLDEELPAEEPTDVEIEVPAEEPPEAAQEVAEQEPVQEELDIEELALEDAPKVEGEEGPEATQEVADQQTVEEIDLEAISQAVDEAAQEPETVSEVASEEEVLDFDLLEGEEKEAEEAKADELLDFEEFDLEEEAEGEETFQLEQEIPADETPGAVREGVVGQPDVKREPKKAREEEMRMPPPGAEKALPAKRRMSTPVLIVLLLGLLGGGAFAAYTYLKGAGPGTLQPAADDPGNLQIALVDQQIRSEFVENTSVGRMFVLKGMVRNDYPEARNFMRVKGVLYAQDGTAVRENTAYCGNILSASELETSDSATMNQRLGNKFGDNRSNFGAPSGKVLPFMLVFTDLPQDFGEFSVQVVSSARAQ